MREEIARCDNCGRIIRENSVVSFSSCAYALIECDYQKTKSSRPSLRFGDITLCLDCVAPYFQRWIDKVKNHEGYIL